MQSDDSFNDSDEIFNLYSSKKVAETFKTNLRKLVSQGIRSGDGERSGDVLKDVNNISEELNSSIEDLQPISDYKVKNADVSISTLSTGPSSEDSLDIIEIVEEKLSPRPTRKSTRLRRKRGESVCDSDDSVTISPEPRSRSRKKPSNIGRRTRSRKKAVVIEEVVLDDSFEPVENLEDEDELNPEVSVKVIWKSVGIKKFQIRKFQKMSKIFEQLSREENISEDKIVLTFNNIKVSRNDSPDSLNLQVYHFIDGGVLSESTNLSEWCEPSSAHRLHNDNNSVTLKFQDVAKRVVKLVLNKDEKMKVAMIKYAEQLEIPLGKIKFFFDGESLDPSETPTSLGLESDEIIDVKILP